MLSISDGLITHLDICSKNSSVTVEAGGWREVCGLSGPGVCGQ